MVAAAIEHGEVLYAVPGSPLVLERTVRTLRADERVRCVVLPAMSFLDLAWARLGIDPVESAVTLIDGHEFATAAAGVTGAMLIAHTHADWVLSDIKLAAEEATGDEPVVILQGLGTAGETITETTWSELDRAVTPDHLTCVYVPAFGVPVGAGYVRFHQLARTLREQCPWDREQTHASLIPFLVEETFELVDALEALDPDDPATEEALVEELGDVLYQIEFHATIAEQAGRFSIADVTAGDPRQARAPPPPRVRHRRGRRRRHREAQLGRHQAGGEGPHVGVRRRRPVAAVAGLRPAPDRARRPRSASTGPTSTVRWPRSTRRSPSCARRSPAATPSASPTSSATWPSPSSTWPATPAPTPSWPCGPPPASSAAASRRVEALAAARGIDLRAADLETLDALWDEVKRAE